MLRTGGGTPPTSYNEARTAASLQVKGMVADFFGNQQLAMHLIPGVGGAVATLTLLDSSVNNSVNTFGLDLAAGYAGY